MGSNEVRIHPHFTKQGVIQIDPDFCELFEKYTFAPFLFVLQFMYLLLKLYQMDMKVQGLMRDDLVYPELSYVIIGCAYDVFNEIGPGHLEKIYQKAMAAAFDEKQLKYREQSPYELQFKKTKVGKGFLDFLVEEKIVVELKRGEHFTRSHIEQVHNYLKLSGMKLALLILFNAQGVRFKRVINAFSEQIRTNNSPD